MRSDLRYALRSLWKTPRFSLVAVLILALGIGATTAMFSVVYNICLRPLAYPQPERLVFVQESSLRQGGISPTAPATYADWRDQQDVFESIAAAEAWGASLTGTNRPEEVAGLRVSTSLLSVLRVSPMLGRGFEPEDEEREAGRVVLLSYSLWQRRFAGDASAVGRTVTLNGASYRVIGVMPAEFRFPPFWQTKAELWAPLATPPQRAHDRAGRSLRVFARLKDGVPLERASAAMSAIASRIERAYPETNTDRGARVLPLQEVVAGPVRQGLIVLFGAVAFLLSIACANVANLSLSRASGRQKEIAIRLALGEIVVWLMLLGGAGLMMRSVARLGAVEPGFDPRSVVTMRLILTGSPHAAPERRNVFYQQVLDRVAAVPGVESASGINHLP